MPWKMPVTRVGHAEIDLRLLAAEIGQRQQQAAEQDADRMQAAEEGDDDGGEAVARRDRRRQLPDRSGHLEQARQARERAAEQQREPDQARVSLKPA